MNIDLNRLDELTIYLKKLAEEYQLMIGECGLELLNFGFTWRRIIKNAQVSSSLDHAFTNKPLSIHSYNKHMIDYSDHYLISVNLKLELPKLQNLNFTSRDFRKLRSNPKFFLNQLSKIDWDYLVHRGHSHST